VSGPTNFLLPADSGCTLKFPHDTRQEDLVLCSHPAYSSVVCERDRPAARVGPGGEYHDLTISFEPMPGLPLGIYNCSGTVLYNFDNGIPGFERSCRLHDVVAYMIGKHAERRGAGENLSPEFDLWVMTCSASVDKSRVHPSRIRYGGPRGETVQVHGDNRAENETAATYHLFGALSGLPPPRESLKFLYTPPPGGRRRTYKKRKNGKKRRQTKRRI
jgi:hypothetical protein